MRPNFILSSLLYATLIIVVAVVTKCIFIKPNQQIITVSCNLTNKPNNIDKPITAYPASKGNGFSVNQQQPYVSTHEKSNAEQLHLELAKVDTLLHLSAYHDQTSRDEILKEMTNPSKQVRDAALAASIQINDRSVIPYLLEIANQTEDAIEKLAILDAIDYIKLPSLTEYQDQQIGIETNHQ